MADYILYVGSHGRDNTYRAGLLFAAATSMAAHLRRVESNLGVKVALLGDAVFLVVDPLVNNIPFPGRGATVGQLIANAVAAGVEIHC